MLIRTAWANIRRYRHPLPQYNTTARTSSTGATRDIPSVLHTTHRRTPGAVIGTITISHPAKLNIVNSPILEQLVDVCHTLSSDPALRAVVLTGAPPILGKSASFIGGADISELEELDSAREARTFIGRVHSACQALRDLPVPVIARVHGHCLGAGLELMAACDLRIATRQSVFGMPEVKIGIPSVVEAALLPGLIGMGRTRRLLYLAESVPAAEAELWGLVEKVVDDEGALDESVDDWLAKLVSMGPGAIRIQKRLTQRWENCAVEEGIQAGIDAFSEAYADGGREPRQYMSRFTGRRRAT